MKCPTCESCEYEQYCGATEIMRKCERHNKKVEMTNEEWTRQCDTEQLAEWIASVVQKAISIKENNDIVMLESAIWWVVWLKQPHTKE